MTASDKRYRWLLSTYPRDYRRERGDELIATLVENTGADGVRPPLREVIALLLGGVRARIGTNRRRGYLDTIRMAVTLGALIFASNAAGIAIHTVYLQPYILHAPRLDTYPLVVVGMTIALYAVVRLGRPRWALTIGIVEVVAVHALIPWYAGLYVSVTQLLPALMIAVAARRGDPRPPLVWLIVAALIGAAGWPLSAQFGLRSPIVVAFVVVVLCCGLFDGRIPLALATVALIALAAAATVTDVMTPFQQRYLGAELIIACLVGGWRARRDAAI